MRKCQTLEIANEEEEGENIFIKQAGRKEQSLKRTQLIFSGKNDFKVYYLNSVK